MVLRARAVLSRLLPAVALLAPGHAPAQAPPAWPNVSPRIEASILPALRLAAERLRSPSCARVLGEFRAREGGRPLSEILDARGLEPADYLATVAFLDGSRQPQCAKTGTLAITPVGSPVVFVCRDPFVRALKKSWGFAATVLIHESLHTLGLGENPPSSEEISARVAERCGW